MPNNCFCDQRGIGDPTQTCGDCPEDYREDTKGNRHDKQEANGHVSLGYCDSNAFVRAVRSMDKSS